MLEYWLRHTDAELRLTVTEFAPETLERLRLFFPESAVCHHNLLADGPVQADVHLLHRVDTEFSNHELKAVMSRFRRSTVLLLATEVLGPRRFVQVLRQRLNPQASKAGVSRTRGAFSALWRHSHVERPMRFNDLDGWVLTPRDGQR